MTEAAKEAKRLFERFEPVCRWSAGTKVAVLICIDEKAKEVSWFKRLDFLEEVKTEIEKL